MEIRDVIHGVIPVSSLEAAVLDSRFFQRLRNIKQLGFAENSYPGATHNRFSHSLGAKHLSAVAFKNIFLRKGGPFRSAPNLPNPPVAKRFETALRLAAMLHDVGHGPLSHTTEFAMPEVSKLDLAELACVPGKACAFSGGRRANHEDYTLKVILKSSLTQKFEQTLAPYEIAPIHIACILNEDIHCPDSFFIEGGIDYRPILHQLVSSEIDVDRMDYLIRDSYYAGVKYGQFDLPWLLSHLTFNVHEGKCYLALEHRAIYTFDDFLLSRFHMFLNVYFHHKSVIFDEMLARYLRSTDCDYTIPSDIEEYVFFDDYHLYTHLSKSENPWAKRIFHKNPYRVLLEVHSGIPNNPEKVEERKREIESLLKKLQEEGIDSILKTTTGELSKYFDQDGRSPIFVRYDSGQGSARFFRLEECTDLFESYKGSRTISRVYAPQSLRSLNMSL